MHETHYRARAKVCRSYLPARGRRSGQRFPSPTPSPGGGLRRSQDRVACMHPPSSDSCILCLYDSFLFLFRRRDPEGTPGSHPHRFRTGFVHSRRWRDKERTLLSPYLPPTSRTIPLSRPASRSPPTKRRPVAGTSVNMGNFSPSIPDSPSYTATKCLQKKLKRRFFYLISASNLSRLLRMLRDVVYGLFPWFEGCGAWVTQLKDGCVSTADFGSLVYKVQV